jgi:hypothetical protein
MLAQWISWIYREGFTHARKEPLITLGSAPLGVPDFRSTVLGQLGESRLVAAIDADISGRQSHARALDADTKGPLRNIHRRVGTTILFESSGGQVNKVAHLPELRFALGEPEVDTTSVDNAAYALDAKAFFIRKIGSDGFQIRHQPTLKKVVSDRRASLDEETEVKPAIRSLVEKEFRRGASIPLVPFPEDGASIQDSPKLALVIFNPESEWTGEESLRKQISDWTKQRGTSPRLYPGSLIWCFKKPGRDLHRKVELWLAWKRVAKEIADGTLGGDFDRSDRTGVHSTVADAEDAAKDEVWGGYRYIGLADSIEPNGLKIIDLGAGHASSGETLCGRIIAALKSQALLNQTVGAGYLERNWPPALKKTGAWPLTSLRQSFLNGSLTRLLDPDTVLQNKLVECVGKGDFGLASGQKSDGSFEHIWFKEMIGPEEVAFEAGVFLLTKEKAESHKEGIRPKPERVTEPISTLESESVTEEPPQTTDETQLVTLRIVGIVPPEMWNRLGTKIIPKLRSGQDISAEIELSANFNPEVLQTTKFEILQILQDLGISDILRIE